MSQQIVGEVARSRGKARLSVMAVVIMAFLIIGFFLTDSMFPPSAVAAGANLMHNSVNTGSGKYGDWGAEFTCDTCHVKLKGANIKKVRTSISTSVGARPVVFTRYTTTSNAVTGVFGNDERTNFADGSRNVCEVCHHRTVYHNYSSTKVAALGLLSHTEHNSNRKDCNTCHKHSLGYRPPSAGNCEDCHAIPPTNPANMVVGSYTLGLTPPADAGAHNRHRNIEGMECYTCHNNYGHGMLGNSLIEIGFRIDKKTWSGFSGMSTVMTGTFTGTIGAPFTNNFAVAPRNPGTVLLRAPGINSCSIYCHGDGWAVPSGKAATGQISWTNGPLGTCSAAACHGTTPANPPNPGPPGAHTRHVGDLQMDCTRCHDAYSSAHMINGRVAWNLSGQGTNAAYKGYKRYSTATLPGVAPYGSCSNIYCHSDVQPEGGVGEPDNYKPITWGSATVLGCDGCHGGRLGDAAPIGSGAHTKHIGGYSYLCSDCHFGAGAEGTLMNHLNNNIEVAFNGYSGSYDQMPVNLPGGGYGNCSANYCHSDAKGNKKSVNWGTAGPLACNACHKADQAGNAVGSGKHGAHVDNAGFLGANYGCATCHASTVSDNATIGNRAKHVNKYADYSGARAGRYDAATGTCSVSYCHSDGKGGAPAVPVAWKDGSTIDNCKGCHGASAGGTFLSVVGEPNYANSGADTTFANSHDRHMGGIGLSTCIYCHNDTVSTTGLKPGTLHLNGAKNIAAGGAKSFTYLGNRTCSDISCHGGPTPAKWGQAFPADCTGCHGNNAASFTPMSSGRHKAHINNAAVLGKNYRCATCHALTANPDDRSIADGSVHGNGFKNFTSPLAGSRSSYTSGTGVCSASYCHSDGKGDQKDMTLTGWKSGATLGCNGCHGSSAAPDFASVYGEPNYVSAGPATLHANDHKNHVDFGAATCVDCHADTVDAAGAILANLSSHTNRRIDVKAGSDKSFGFAAADKSCSDISCHGGKGSFTQVWGTPVKADCTGCHGNNAASSNPLASNRHASHLSDPARGGSLNCTECHVKTINPDERSFANRTLHGNGFVDYSGTRAGGSASYDTATGACSATYCHTDGKGVQNEPFALSTGWKSTTVYSNCIGCHGNSTPADFQSRAGEPNYASTGAGAARANSHKVHVGTAGGVTCAYCHSTSVGADGSSVLGNHLNRSIGYESSAVAGKTFIPGAGTSCSNIACHGAGSPPVTWGDNLACNGCHGGNAGNTPIATGRHTAHIDNADYLGANFGCAECHAQVVSGDTAFGNRARHADGYPNYSGAMAGSNRASCNAAYCHSDGKGRPGIAVSWSGGPSLGCNGCHGTGTASGAPDYPNSGGAGSASSNSHLAHTASGAGSCDTCHTGTVTAAGTAIRSGSTHLDRVIDVSFNRGSEATAQWNGASRTCSNISCHSNGNATWGDPTGLGCIVCHANLGSSGVHAIHINDLLTSGTASFYSYTANKSQGSLYRFGCANCHPTDPARHRNGTVDVTINKFKAGGSHLNALNTLATADGIDTPNSGVTGTTRTNVSCELSYCHSNGRTSNPVLADYKGSPNWYTATPAANRCGMCHDNPPQYAGQSHYVAASSLGNNGTPPYRESGHLVGIHSRNSYKGNKQNGFLGFSSSGNMAHGNQALASTMGCYVCHSGIVSDTQIDTYAMSGSGSRFRCDSCHTAGSRTPLQPGMVVDTALHINGAKDIAFPKAGPKGTFKTKAQLANVANALGWVRSGSYKEADSYDSADLTVSSWTRDAGGTVTCLTACHVNQPNITWGAQLKCVSCHANQ